MKNERKTKTVHGGMADSMQVGDFFVISDSCPSLRRPANPRGIPGFIQIVSEQKWWEALEGEGFVVAPISSSPNQSPFDPRRLEYSNTLQSLVR